MKSLEFGWKNLTMIFVVDINCFGMLKCNSTTLNFLVIILGVYLTTTVSSSSLGTVADGENFFYGDNLYHPLFNKIGQIGIHRVIYRSLMFSISSNVS